MTITSKESLSRYISEIRKYPFADETELGKRIRQGDDKALEELITGNLRYVISVAKEYQHRGLPLADLVGEGNLGLIRAAHSFDETKGFKFISYAMRRIRWQIQEALLVSHAVRLPQTQIGLRRIRTVSLDAEVDDDITLLDTIPYKEDEELEINLSSLDERERRFVKRYYFEDQTLHKVAKEFGLSYGATYRLKERILEKLRN